MRLILTFVVAVFAFFGSDHSASGGDTKRAAEVKWAKQIAMDFLESAKDYDVVSGLLSPEMARVVKDNHDWYLRWGFDYYCEPRIIAEELAPNGSEVLFRGTLKGKGMWTAEEKMPDADFVLRVGKESAGGKWSIRFLQIKVREEKPKK